MKYRYILLFTILSIAITVQGQVVIGANKEPENFSMLQIEGQNGNNISGGIRLPVLTTDQRNGLNIANNQKAKGLLIYNSSVKGIEYWDGNKWITLPYSISSQNVITKVGTNNVRLGGALIENTTIDMSDKNLYFDFTSGKLNIADQLLVVSGNNIGIKTDNPQGILHIDGQKDNSTTPTSTQLKNDIIVNSSGQMGIGMLPNSSDASALQIDGPFTIKNAGESPVSGYDYVLATTDGTGVIKWVKNYTLQQKVVGKFGSGYSGIAYANISSSTGVNVTLNPGKWIIQSNIIISLNTALSSSQSLWVRMAWRKSNGSEPVIIGARLTSGTVFAYTNSGMAVGSTIINNDSDSTQTYYLYIENNDDSGSVFGNRRFVNVGEKRDENSVVAFPVSSGL